MRGKRRGSAYNACGHVVRNAGHKPLCTQSVALHADDIWKSRGQTPTGVGGTTRSGPFVWGFHCSSLSLLQGSNVNCRMSLFPLCLCPPVHNTHRPTQYGERMPANTWTGAIVSLTCVNRFNSDSVGTAVIPVSQMRKQTQRGYMTAPLHPPPTHTQPRSLDHGELPMHVN